eukprot:ANDGO_06207.mRNA.1 Ribosome biogenesis protein enp2 homolog
MDITNFNGVKVYNVTSAASKLLPAFLKARGEKIKKVSQTDSIDLLQEFEFPSACNCITMSEDLQTVIAAGSYKPQIKVWETEELTMKFMRSMDSEVMKVQPLTEDWKKLVTLHADRYVGFHAQFGLYHSLRLPAFGRDLAYDCRTCDLFAVGMSSEVYRINLEEGRFQTPLSSASGVSCEYLLSCDRQKMGTGVLFAAGGDDGLVQFWDLRTKAAVSYLKVSEHDVSRVRFCPANSVHMAAGDASGVVRIFDLRMSEPILTKDHNFEVPIVQIHFHEGSNKWISACERAIKVWDAQTGDAFTSMEPYSAVPSGRGSTVTTNLSIAKKKKKLFKNNSVVDGAFSGAAVHSDSTNDFSGRITDFCVAAGDRGLLFVGGDCPHMQSYFIPELGPAPRWCSFLDSVAEDFSEQVPTFYTDYKFVTRAELDALGLTHLIGTDMLRDYMHGFFMDIRLYKKAKSVADPFEFKKYREEQVQSKIKSERASRVGLAQPTAGAVDKPAVSQKVLKDSRFAQLIDGNADFEIDEESAEFKRAFPGGRQKLLRNGGDDSEDSEAENETRPVEESAISSERSEENEGDDNDSEDEDVINRVYLDPLAKNKASRALRQAEKERELVRKREVEDEEQRARKKARKQPMEDRLALEDNSSKGSRPIRSASTDKFRDRRRMNFRK